MSTEATDISTEMQYNRNGWQIGNVVSLKHIVAIVKLSPCPFLRSGT